MCWILVNIHLDLCGFEPAHMERQRLVGRMRRPAEGSRPRNEQGCVALSQRIRDKMQAHCPFIHIHLLIMPFARIRCIVTARTCRRLKVKLALRHQPRLTVEPLLLRLSDSLLPLHPRGPSLTSACTPRLNNKSSVLPAAHLSQGARPAGGTLHRRRGASHIPSPDPPCSLPPCIPPPC